jgi:hypothetical protein
MTLVADADTGVAGLSGKTNVHTSIVWPYGYSLQSDAAGAALLDYQGNVLAHVGDRVRVGGGELPDGAFNGCGEVEPLPGETPH